MARSTTLDSVIYTIFHGSDTNSRIRYQRAQDTSPVTSKKYMEIPLTGNVFELPVLAFDAFLDMKRECLDMDVLVAQLYSCGTTSDYKSLDAIMRDALSTKFSNHLTQVQVAGCSTTYYCTYGAVFSADMKPLMMLSWLMEKKIDGNGMKYYFKRPLLRLNPGICVSKEDSVQRFLAEKLMINCLNQPITTPYYIYCDSFLEQSRAFSSRSSFQTKVEIDECPFLIKDTDTPSISVTNKGLLQLAADHIDEILQ